MRSSLYANPAFATGLSSLVQTFMGGNPADVARTELTAAQAGLANDTRRYREAIGEAGRGGDLTGLLVSALQGGYGGAAPSIASSLASLPGSGMTPEQQAQIQVGTGTQNAGGTFTGLEQTLANAYARTGLEVQGRRDVAQMGIDADRDLAQQGFETFQSALGGVTPGAQTALERLIAEAGPLNVTSGYRTPERNAAVGGAKNSQHTHGNAFDIATAGMDDEARAALIMQAREAGFQGIGVYDDSLHFDVGPERAWGPSYGRESLPGWAENAATGPIEMLLAAGAPGVSPTQSRILQSLAGGGGTTADPRALTAGGRSALLAALGDDVDPGAGLSIVAAAEDILRRHLGMSENDVLAYAANPENLTRGPGEPARDTWLPFDAKEAVPGPVTGLKPFAAPDPRTAAVLDEARAAIAAGADPEKVRARLAEMGIDAAGI